MYKFFFLLMFFFLLLSCTNTQQHTGTDFSVKKNDYAVHFRMGYLNDKRQIIEVTNLWADNSARKEQYLLRKDTLSKPVSNFLTVQIPLKRVVCLSASHVAQLAQINKLDAIVGVSGASYIYNKQIQLKYANGEIVSFPDAQNINLEELINLKPDAVFMAGVQASDYQVAEKIRFFGIPVIFNNDYLEQNPLGRAEWTIFMASFFEVQDLAKQQFDSIAAIYNALKDSIAQHSSKPTVFLNIPFKDIWYMPGGNSYFARLIADAGGEYVFQNQASEKSLALDFEYVFTSCAEADFWLNAGALTQAAQLLEADQRFIHFKAWKNKQVFNPVKRMDIGGANDFWEQGVTHPHLLLADLAAIFSHQNSELYFYQHLK